MLNGVLIFKENRLARHLCNIKIGLFNVYDFISPIKYCVVIPLVVVSALTIIHSLRSCSNRHKSKW